MFGEMGVNNILLLIFCNKKKKIKYMIILLVLLLFCTFVLQRHFGEIFIQMEILIISFFINLVNSQKISQIIQA